MPDYAQPPNVALVAEVLTSLTEGVDVAIPPLEEVVELVESVLLETQGAEGQQLWNCLREGIITEIECRNALYEYFFEWVWANSEQSESVLADMRRIDLSRLDMRLYGRPARWAPTMPASTRWTVLRWISDSHRLVVGSGLSERQAYELVTKCKTDKPGQFFFAQEESGAGTV